ncbi:MAG TPA: glycosyltransferase family 2 protein [bacterium]|nr:glycosyltransferase family 2 protein [bacterium]
MTTSRPSLSIFVPAHNEARNLEGAIHDIVAATQPGLTDYEILLVDDGSTDGTAEVAEGLARDNPRIRVIHNRSKEGIARGYRTALGLATKEYFGFLPGDREVHADSIRAIFDAVGSSDLIIPYHANREARAWHRRVMTWVCTTLLNTLFGHHLHYYQGPTVYPTQLAMALPSRSTGFFFLTEMLVHALDGGRSFIEVGLIHQERAFGKSKAITFRNIRMALAVILGTWWRLRVGRVWRGRLGSVKTASLKEKAKP